MDKVIKIACSSDNYANISDLQPFEDNPRELTDMGFSKLKKSLLSLGLFKPLLVWKRDNKILGGNQRYLVIEHLIENDGYSIEGPVPVTYIDCDEATARTIVLRDNQSDGDWAYEMLAEYMNDLEELGGDLTLTGFSDKEMTDLKKLAQSSDDLRKDLEELAKDTDGEDMLKKKFTVNFKVPEEEWDIYQDAISFAKKETGIDDPWENFKYYLKHHYEEFTKDTPSKDIDMQKVDIEESELESDSDYDYNFDDLSPDDVL